MDILITLSESTWKNFPGVYDADRRLSHDVKRQSDQRAVLIASTAYLHPPPESSSTPKTAANRNSRSDFNLVIS